MLATIAVILIVIWAIGFFARLVGHVIHAILLIAFVLLIAHHFKLGHIDRFDRDSGHGSLHHPHRSEAE